MANLYGKNCNPDILNPEQEKKAYIDPVLTLKKNHVFVGNENAEVIEALLDSDFFKIDPRTCNSPKLSLQKFDHGYLSGLDEDDHEQYVHVSIDREISANHVFTGDLIFEGISHFTSGVRDARGILGENLTILSSAGTGRLQWRDISEFEISHSDLINLDADDHLQYVHVSEKREISADHLFTGDIEVSGSITISGLLKDSDGGSPVKGQIPIADDSGKFQWRTPVIENVYWVSKDGDDNNDGLSPQTAKASIKAAVRTSHSGVLGKIMDAAESILANKKLITDEVNTQLYTRVFNLPNSTSFDLKTRSAYRLILSNKDLLVNESIESVFTENEGGSDVNGKCTRDSKYLVLALAKDIFYGGYKNIYQFVSGYFDVNNNFIDTIFSAQEKTLTIQVFDLIKTKLKTQVLSGSTYTYIKTRIDELFKYVIDSLTSESITDIFPSLSAQTTIKEDIYYSLDKFVDEVWQLVFNNYVEARGTESTCKRDIRYVTIGVAEDIYSWGNSNTLEAAKQYYNNVAIFSNDIERQASAYAYEQLRNKIRDLTTNQAVIDKINRIFNPLISVLEEADNVNALLIDSDQGNLNKSAKLCNRDLGYFIDAVASDMKNGGNVFSVEFAEGYYEGNNLQFIQNQLEDTIWAFNKARELMILAMKNWRSTAGGILYNPEFSLEKIFVDNSIVYEDWPACANAETAINNYYGIISYILENGPNADAKAARDLIYTQISRGDDPNSIVNYVWNQTSIKYPLIESTENKCRRDLILILEGIAEDLYSSGNLNTIKIIRSYFPDSGNPIETQITESVFAYSLARDYLVDNVLASSRYSLIRPKVNELFEYIITALNDGNLDSLPVEEPGNWTIQKPSYKTTIFVNPGVYWEENPIHLPPNTVITGDSLRGITVNAMNRTLDMFHVNNACGLSFMTFSNHLAPSYAVSFPKKNGQGIAGIISRSPYIQQCTSITTTGGGMLVDGAITEGFKSMVLDSYTQYNQGGPGVKIINNGYAQLVSLFTISCSIGIECDTGGQCDLTNSNSSLGDYGLVADGVGDIEIIATVMDDIAVGDTRLRVKLPGTLKPYNGQAGFFGTKYYSIQEIKVIDGGEGYITAPIITIDTPTGPQGIPARARAILDNGSVSEIIMIKNGTAYTELPNITFSAPTGENARALTYEVVLRPIYYQVISSTPIADDGTSIVTLINPVNYPITKGMSFVLSRQSKVLASGHSFEYIGAGPNIKTALPIRNGTFIQQQEIDERNGGSVIFTSTDQSGNFRIGDGVIIDQTTGTIGGVSFSRGLFAQITPLILALQ